MELYLLDSHFDPVATPVEEFTSLTWVERYYSSGSFTARFPSYMAPLPEGVRYISDGENCGCVDYIKVFDGGDIEAGGALLESMLEDRVISGRGFFEGRVSDVAVNAVTDNARGLELSVAEDSKVITSSGVWDYSWNVLSAWVRRVLKPYGASYSIKLGAEGKPRFRIVRGEEREAVVLSASYENIADLTYSEKVGQAKNKVYVEGNDGTVVTLDHSSGGEVRECYVRATGISPGSFEDTASYTAALTTKGNETLAKQSDGLRVLCETSPDSHPQYGLDYFLGDICHLADPAFGLSAAVRLCEVKTVITAGERRIYHTFGDK